MKDQFTIWIKKFIDGGRINPPDKAWENISQKLDIENSWQNIDKNLDIDTVWNRLNHQLVTDARMKIYEKISYIPIVALLLLLSWLGVKNEIYNEPINENSAIAQQIISDQKVDSNSIINELQQKKQTKKAKTEDIDQTAERNTESHRKNQELEKNNISVGENQESNKTSFTTKEEKLTEFNKDDNSESAAKYSSDIDNSLESKKTSPDYLSSIPGGLIVNFDGVNRTAPDFIKFAKDSIIRESKKTQWYYGIGLSGNRTWLKDNRLKRASEGSSLYNAIASNNLSFKINAGLNLNQNWALQTDITLLGSIGQSYGEYINGKYKKGNININYNGLQIGVKRNLPSLFSVANLLNKQIVGGGYANHIYQVTQNENIFILNENNQLIISNLYKNVDFGVWAGIEMFYRLNQSYLLGTALHYKYGLNNIYKGNNKIPAYLRKTNTSELSISIILRRNSN